MMHQDKLKQIVSCPKLAWLLLTEVNFQHKLHEAREHLLC